MEVFDNKTELVDMEQKKPLVIFKTEVDRYGRDIAAMSDFIALILSSQIKNIMNDARWFRNHDMQEVIGEMKSLRVVPVEGKCKRIYTTMTFFQKEIVELFGLSIG